MNITEEELIEKWEIKWNKWAKKAVPLARENAKECRKAHPEGGKPLMSCIAKKNSETLTKAAIELLEEATE